MQNRFPLNLNSSITSWMVQGSIRGKDKGVFSKTSRPAVDLTQHLIQWVAWILSLRVGNIHLVLRLRMSEPTHLFPIGLCLHGVYRDSLTLFFTACY